MKKISFYTLAIIFLLCLSPVTVQAQEGEPATQPAATQPAPAASTRVWPPNRDHARGLALTGGFGVSGCDDNICDDFDPLVYFRFQAMFRVLNYLGVGLHLAMPFHDANSDIVDVTYDFYLGAEVRGFLPLWRFDLWTGIGLGWFRKQYDGEGCIGGYCAEGSIWYDGFGFGWGFGVNFWITRAMAVGVEFWLYKPLFVEGCTDIEGADTECRDVDDYIDQDDVGITWTFGLNFTYFLPF